MANHNLSYAQFAFGQLTFPLLFPNQPVQWDKSHGSFPICTLPRCQDDGLHFDLGDDGHDSLHRVLLHFTVMHSTHYWVHNNKMEWSTSYSLVTSLLQTIWNTMPWNGVTIPSGNHSFHLHLTQMYRLGLFGILVGSAHANLKFSWCSWRNVIGHFGPTQQNLKFQSATSGKFWNVSWQWTHKPETHWSKGQNVVGHFGPLTQNLPLYSGTSITMISINTPGVIFTYWRI